MSTRKEAWTRAHDLALVQLALAYGTDHDLSDAELNMITSNLQRWRGDVPVEEVQEVVMEAMTVYLEPNAREEVGRAIGDLRDALSDEERREALEGMMRIAEADGVLLTSERSLISALAQAWGIKATGQDLIRQTTAAVEQQPSWSMMHDIGLMYVVLAHSTDNELSQPEIDAIIQRLTDWQPELDEQEVRRVLREALQVYADEPGRDILGASVRAIRNGLPMVQRLALLDDLVYIGEVDGGLNAEEKELISTLAQAWQVHIRLNGQAGVAQPS